MAKKSPHRCIIVATDSPCLVLILWLLHVSAFIALMASVNWKFCHLRGKGPCRIERDQGSYDYVTSNLTWDQKGKCEKYESGTTKYYLKYKSTMYNRVSFAQ